jgi:hypothetical protein
LAQVNAPDVRLCETSATSKVDDQPVFIDAGTYLYYSAGSVRSQLRESAAHNTS